MAPCRTPWLLFILLPLFAPVASAHIIAAYSIRALHPSLLQEWLNEIFFGHLPGNASLQQGCDYSQQAWALNAIQFKNNAAVFMALADLEPCARTIEGTLLHYDFRSSPRQNGSVGIPFRETVRDEGLDLTCLVYSGTFIRDVSSLYVVSESAKISKLLGLNEWKSPEVHPDLGWGNPTSSGSLLGTMSKHDVPGYATAVDEANGDISIYQDTVKELSPSNVAILLLPMLLSFVPASAITDDFTAYGTLLYAMATDFLTNIPVLIKGGELLYINSLQKTGNAARTLAIGNAQLQFVEVWVTRCEVSLRSFILGLSFTFAALWAMAVGFITEFLVWKFEAEKREDQLHGDNFSPRESQSQSTVNENEDIQPLRKRLKYAHDTGSRSMTVRNSSSPLTSENNSRKRKHSDMACEARIEIGSGPDEILMSSGDRKRNLTEFAFFFVGAVLSVLVVIPFLAFRFLRFQYFKKTEQREWFFKIGVMVGSMNMVYGFCRVFMGKVYFYVFVFLFDLLILFLLRKWKLKHCPCFRRTAPAQEDTETNDAQESSEVRFYIAGFLLGLLVSVLSTLYVRCFPWIRGNKRRRRMLKIGCMIGGFTNIVVWTSPFGLGDYILVYNVLFLFSLVLFETDVLYSATQD